nr:TetR/AcrR family transcriptional regulator [Tropicimonas sp. IMCC34043]
MSEGRIKRGRKFDQVVLGAREIFLQDGFEGASVDLIAKAAGVSKATLYSYFPDKRLLFMEVAKTECRRQATGGIDHIDPDLPPEIVLRDAAIRVTSFLMSDFGRAMFRVVVAETVRFPGLGREFWVNGPARARGVLIDYFRTAVARGSLEIEDIDLAADQFIELCKAGIFTRLMIGLDDTISQEECDRVMHGAVEMFMARYGARDAVQSIRRTSN